MTWTPELQKTAEIVAARLRAAMTQPDANPLHRDAHIVIIRTLDALESQQAELDAARQVIKQSRLVSQVKTQDDMYETVHAFPELAAAIDTYDAARAEQEAT